MLPHNLLSSNARSAGAQKRFQPMHGMATCVHAALSGMRCTASVLAGPALSRHWDDDAPHQDTAG